MEDFSYGMEKEWKKIPSTEYGKIVFHSIPYHALPVTSLMNGLRSTSLPYITTELSITAL